MEQNHYYSPSDIAGRECKNITYATDEEKENDCVLVKEVIHTNDGRQIPAIRIAENVKRPIYITQHSIVTIRKRKNTKSGASVRN